MEDAPDRGDHSGEREIHLHPLVAKLLEAIEGEEGVVELRGFLGPAWEDDDPVPLYTTVELTKRILVPQDAVVRVEGSESNRGNHKPTRIYVKRSAELRLVSPHVTTRGADEESSTLSAEPIEGVGTSFPGFGSVSAECGGQLSACLGAAGSDFHGQIECISNYVRCMEIARL